MDNFYKQTISKTLNSQKVGLNGAVKLKFSGHTSVIEANKWIKFEEDWPHLLWTTVELGWNYHFLRTQIFVNYFTQEQFHLQITQIFLRGQGMELTVKIFEKF